MRSLFLIFMSTEEPPMMYLMKTTFFRLKIIAWHLGDHHRCHYSFIKCQIQWLCDSQNHHSKLYAPLSPSAKIDQRIIVAVRYYFHCHQWCHLQWDHYSYKLYGKFWPLSSLVPISSLQICHGMNENMNLIIREMTLELIN